MTITQGKRRSPGHLSRKTRDFWLTCERTYEMDAHHIEVLTRCCEAMDRVDQARAVIEKEGLQVEDRFGQVKPHPLLAVERDNRIQIARLIRELGFDLSAPPEARPPRAGG